MQHCTTCPHPASQMHAPNSGGPARAAPLQHCSRGHHNASHTTAAPSQRHPPAQSDALLAASRAHAAPWFGLRWRQRSQVRADDGGHPGLRAAPRQVPVHAPLGLAHGTRGCLKAPHPCLRQNRAARCLRRRCFLQQLPRPLWRHRRAAAGGGVAGRGGGAACDPVAILLSPGQLQATLQRGRQPGGWLECRGVKVATRHRCRGQGE